MSGTSHLHGQRSAPTSTSTYKCVLCPKDSVLYQLSQHPIHCILWFQNNLLTNSNYIITALNNMMTRLNSVSQWIHNSSLKRQHNVFPLLSHTIRFSLRFKLNQWQKVTLYNETYAIGTFDAGDVCGLTLLTIQSLNCDGTLVTCWDNIMFGIKSLTGDLHKCKNCSF